MPYFTSKPVDVAYETLMKRIPRFEPDPLECEVIQMDLDRQKKKRRRQRENNSNRHGRRENAGS